LEWKSRKKTFFLAECECWAVWSYTFLLEGDVYGETMLVSFSILENGNFGSSSSMHICRSFGCFFCSVVRFFE
jgi:hypothetical protein